MISAPPNYGAFASEGAALEAVLSRLAEALRPFRIYLFGSRAEGRARPDSDFDLLVVFENEATNNDADYHAVSEPLRGLGIGCDVVPCLKSEFEEVLADPTNPWQKVWAAAKRVYERPLRRRLGIGSHRLLDGCSISPPARISKKMSMSSGSWSKMRGPS